MPPKLGLLGTLSTIAIGITATSANAADLLCTDKIGRHHHLHDLCSCEAVEKAEDPAELQAIIDELLATNPNSACIVQAAAKQALLTNTAEGPVTLN